MKLYEIPKASPLYGRSELHKIAPRYYLLIKEVYAVLLPLDELERETCNLQTDLRINLYLAKNRPTFFRG